MAVAFLGAITILCSPHVILPSPLGILPSAFVVAQTPPAAGLIRHIVAEGNFALVVKADGSVVFWGQEEGGLAARPRSPSGVASSPIAIALPGKARQVALGAVTAYALLEDGTVWAWGGNVDGQLGNGAPGANGVLGIYPKPSVTPVKVTGLTDIIQIESGSKHALALRKDGTVWAWGTRDNGAVGDGERGGRVLSALAPVAVPGLEGITQIAAAHTHNLALRRDGHLVSWGSNGEGELGIGTRFTGWTPAEVMGLDRVVAIDAGGWGRGSSGAMRDDGTVWMWGSNVETMMGNGAGPLSPDDPGARNPLPMQVKGIAGAKSLRLGSGHVAVLLGDGTLRMWGHDGYGQIGVGTSGGYHQRPTTVTTIANVAAVYLGGLHSFAVRADGTLWIWGMAFSYQAEGILAKNLKVPTRLDLP